MRGWIKLHRQISENEFYFSERFTKTQAWIDLLLLANHAPGTFFVRGNEVNLTRAQLGYSIKSLSQRWKWNERTVNKYLMMLQNRGMIQCKKTQITTIITILNYETFQGDTAQNAEQNAEQTQNRIHTNNNDNNVNNDNNTNGEGKTPDYFMMIFHQNIPPKREYVEAWTMWVDYCRASDIKINRYSASEQLRFLKMELSEKKDIVQIIKDSITNNYKGLKYARTNGGNTGSRSGNKNDGATIDELAKIIQRRADRGKGAFDSQKYERLLNMEPV